MSEQQLDALFEDAREKSNDKMQREFESWDAATHEDFLELRTQDGRGGVYMARGDVLLVSLTETSGLSRLETAFPKGY